MAPRVAAQRLVEAAIAAMSREWKKIETEFEPDQREDFKAWVWDLVRTRFVGTKTLPPAADAE